MRSWLFLAILSISGLVHAPAHADLAQEILGHWRYDGFFYEGHRYPLPNPDLDLSFTFSPDGACRLFWIRKNESGYCERIAKFTVNQGQLWQKVVWVNPGNKSDCQADSDMQMNQETSTTISIQNSELWLHLEMSGKPFIYILKFDPLFSSVVDSNPEAAVLKTELPLLPLQ